MADDELDEDELDEAGFSVRFLFGGAGVGLLFGFSG